MSIWTWIIFGVFAVCIAWILGIKYGMELSIQNHKEHMKMKKNILFTGFYYFGKYITGK